MKIKEKAKAALKAGEEKFFSQFGFDWRDATFTNIVDYMHRPKDSSSLAVTRILFGLMMLFDISDERGGANMKNRWGDPDICHFPLLPFLQAIPMPYMAVVYAGLWLGAIGIMLGYKYRISAIMFTVCYWYLFLIEKSFWNNHSYLFGLVALLLTFTEANSYWSLDVYVDSSQMKMAVPYWNYFILKYQFFILYFMAGLKKGTAEWLTGYSVQNLSEHWVFGLFKLFLTVPQIDYLIVHWFIFVFDLSVAMWMMYSRTRHVAMVFCALFHLMNSRLFRIGMFPWVCLATMPLFYPFDWPKVLLCKFEFYYIKIKNNICTRINEAFSDKGCSCKLTAEEKDNTDLVNHAKSIDKEIENNEPKELAVNELEGIKKIEQSEDSSIEEDDVFDDEINFKSVRYNDENYTKTKDDTHIKGHNYNRKRITLYLIIFHVVTQAFLPYSHFITKGYNNWTNGLYGYSWDMMVHSWDTHAVIVKVVDNNNQLEFYIDPNIHTPNDRWTRHNDMVYQYTRCLRDKLIEKANAFGPSRKTSLNLSIYIDVWCSMNGRFTQRHYDSKVDMLKVDWSPFKGSSYLMPLLDEALDWREELDARRKYVHSWSSNNDVVFLADFPGYKQEKYISGDLRNVTLTILKGEVVYEPQVTKLQDGHSYKMFTGQNIPVNIGAFHKVMNIGEKPAYYMYTFYNNTKVAVKDSISTHKLPILSELFNRFIKMSEFIQLLLKNLGNMFVWLSKCN